MRRITIASLMAIGVLTAIAAAACGQGSQPTTTTTTPTTSTTPAGVSFGQMSDAGKAVFAAKCASCHGNNGQGVTAPPVIGTSANLAKYQTAQGLLTFIDTNMPFNAPGSLTHAEYLQVLSYLLVQNQDVAVTTLFINEGQLGGMTLK